MRLFPLIAISLCIYLNLLSISGSKILLSPWVALFNSRFNSMLRLADILIEDGHEVSVLVPTFLKEKVKNKAIHIIEFKMDAPIDYGDDVDLSDAADALDIGKLMGQMAFSIMINMVEIPVTEHFYKDTTAQMKLKEERFDLLFADGLYQITRAVIDFMDIPTVIYSPDGTFPDSSMFYPVITSFVCPPFKGFCGEGDKLSFWIRLQNFVTEVGLDFYMWPSLADPVDALRQKYNINTSVSARDSYRKHLIFANIDSVMEPPMPLMPHIIRIPGLFINDPEPLKDSDVAAFMDSANENGAIVMSLGTLMDSFGLNTENLIVEVFNTLPQKVIWKYGGEFPTKANDNIMIRKWMDQPNLLAHKNTKLFITHGGSHSMFETAYRGVPVVCIPFFLDQFTHCKNLATRLKMGVILEPGKITKETFALALNEVLNNPIYTNNAKRIQSILLDRPVNPKELFLYWINYTIKHKGAHHLVSSVPFELNIFQYLSLDVVAFLASIPLTVLLAFWCVCKRICTKITPKVTDPKKVN